MDASAFATQVTNSISAMTGITTSLVNTLTQMANSYTFTNVNQTVFPSLSATATTVNMPSTTGSTPSSGSVAAPGTVSLTSYISLPGVTLGNLAAIGTYASQTLTAYTLALATPTLVSPPSTTTYNTTRWSETYWTNLKSGIDAFVNNITGADDIDSTITKLTSDSTKLQVAFYAQDLERKQQVLRDLYSAAQSSVGNKGFLFPNSMTVALKLDAQQKFQFDLSQTSRDLIKWLFEWAKSNWQFTVDKGITAHNSDIDFNMRYCDVMLKSYATNVNAQIDLYKGQITYELGVADNAIKEFLAEVEAVAKQYIAVDDNKVKRYVAESETILKEFAARKAAEVAKFSAESANAIGSYSANADAIIKAFSATSQNQIGAYGATNSAQAALTQAYASWNKVLIDNVNDHDRNLITNAIGNAEAAVKTANINIASAQAGVTARIQAAAEGIKGATALAGTSSQLAVGIL